MSLAFHTMSEKPPTATVLLLVRHGVTATTGTTLYGRSPGVHLSSEGTAQAEAVATRLAELGGITSVVASPLERTQETAQPIASALGLEITTDAQWIEADFGEWTNRTLKDLAALPEWSAVQNRPSTFRFPNGESFMEMQGRAVAAVDELVRLHRGERIVVVSHADVIKATVAHFVGTHLDQFQRIVISPCSITPIQFGDHAPVVLAINSTASGLPNLAPS